MQVFFTCIKYMTLKQEMDDFERKKKVGRNGKLQYLKKKILGKVYNFTEYFVFQNILDIFFLRIKTLNGGGGSIYPTLLPKCIFFKLLPNYLS